MNAQKVQMRDATDRDKHGRGVSLHAIEQQIAEAEKVAREAEAAGDAVMAKNFHRQAELLRHRPGIFGGGRRFT